MSDRWARLAVSGFVGAGLLAGVGLAQVKARQEAQDKRIEEGRKDGSLTKKEAAKLKAKDAALDAKIKRDRKDGGGLTPAERKSIRKAQNKQSKAIHDQRHDAQKK